MHTNATISRTRRSLGLLAGGVALALFAAGCSESAPSAPAGGGDTVTESPLSGGSTTIFDATSSAFSMPMPNLSGPSFELHVAGDVAFEAKYVTAPAPVHGGLGPIYNNTSCVSCHAGDGRGRPPEPGEAFSSMLFRVSVPGTGPNGAPADAPGFGTQLQDRAVQGTVPEATISVTYSDSAGTFGDGGTFALRVPHYQFVQSYTALPGGLLLSPRVAPPVFGLGLLEAVPEATILAAADELDRNGDGISGRPNYVWDVRAGRAVLGRFGWKANTPNLLQQAAAAFNADMGVTSSLFRVESCHGQQQDNGVDHDPEVSDDALEAAAYYTRTLAVPARRSVDNVYVIRGAQIFRDANCSGCHLPSLRTGASPDVPELADQEIHPYTDLLLHDMGDALADGRPDFLATGREWRTPPLWGIGLTQLVNGHTNFLHDGRARTLLEAILWHGGEAAKSRDYVRNLSASDRSALIAFLNSL